MTSKVQCEPRERSLLQSWSVIHPIRKITCGRWKLMHTRTEVKYKQLKTHCWNPHIPKLTTYDLPNLSTQENPHKLTHPPSTMVKLNTNPTLLTLLSTILLLLPSITLAKAIPNPFLSERDYYGIVCTGSDTFTCGSTTVAVSDCVDNTYCDDDNSVESLPFGSCSAEQVIVGCKAFADCSCVLVDCSDC